ncbi:MAG: queuosine precursor transporter [Verrucomicrobia bacterium]|nr:queuosine precursor transporter [Verrucomicrobiota bacterium]
MTNEMIFLFQVLFMVGWALSALRLGKEALIASISLQALIANLFVVKQITLFGLNVCATDAYVVGTMLLLDLLQEFHGMKAAKQGILVSFLSLIFFGMMSQIHLLYTPSPFDSFHNTYELLLSSQPRILFASFISYLTTQQVDRLLFQKLKDRFPFLPFSLRSALSTLPAQLLDTVMFTFIGLAGLVADLGSVILLPSFIKFLVILISAPFTEFAHKIVKRSDVTI